MTRVPQNGGIQSQIDLALNPEWGNTTQYVTKVTVPKGTVIYEGAAAPQSINGGAGQLLGGGNQVYIPEVNASWLKQNVIVKKDMEQKLILINYLKS